MKILQLGTGKVLWEGPNLRAADLWGADLRGANLWAANLSDANLWAANLSDADLRSANLRAADLRGANLLGANLRSANLSDANLSDANLRSANLWAADLRSANLRAADLRGANLLGANLRSANLSDANLSDANLPAFQIPQEGILICWKKLSNDILAKVQIPAKAKRTASLVGRKCRAEYVKVLEIVGADSGVSAYHDNKTTYRKGTIVRPDSYDPDIRVECSHGIHFFLTREEAEAY